MVRVLVVFPYHGELIAPFHVRYLYPVVDEFIIVEARHTPSGSRKTELLFEKHRAAFEPYMDKITFLVHEDAPSRPEDGEMAFAEAHIRRNVLEKDPKAKLLVVCAACDEVCSRDLIEFSKSHHTYFSESPVFLEFKWFYYNFHWEKKQPWSSTFMVNEQGIRGGITFDEARLRMPRERVLPMAGWRFSSFTPKDEDETCREIRPAQTETQGTDSFEHCAPFRGAPSDLPSGWEEVQAVLDELQKMRGEAWDHQSL